MRAVEKGVKGSSDSKALTGAQAQTIKVTSKEGVGAQFQTPEVTSALVLHGSSSEGLMDVEGLVNQATLETPIITISRESTLEYARSGEGPFLPSPASSFKAEQSGPKQRERWDQCQVTRRLFCPWLRLFGLRPSFYWLSM